MDTTQHQYCRENESMMGNPLFLASVKLIDLLMTSETIVFDRISGENLGLHTKNECLRIRGDLCMYMN